MQRDNHWRQRRGKSDASPDREQRRTDAEEGPRTINEPEDDRSQYAETNELRGAPHCMADCVGPGEEVPLDDRGHNRPFRARRELRCGREQHRDDVVGGHASLVPQEIQTDGSAGGVPAEDHQALWKHVRRGAGHNSGDSARDHEGKDQQCAEKRLAGLLIDEEDQGEIEAVLGNPRKESAGTNKAKRG